MTLKWRLIVISILALVCFAFGFGSRGCVGKHEDSVHVMAAKQGEKIAEAAQAQEVMLDQESSKRAPVLASDDAEVERDEDAQASASKASPMSNVPGIEPLATPALVVADQTLLGALKKDLADTKDQLATEHQAHLAADARANALQEANLQLHAALDSRPKELNWGASVIYGTNQTEGAGVEYRVGPVSAGIDVVRHPLNGGQSTLEAQARLTFHF